MDRQNEIVMAEIVGKTRTYYLDRNGEQFGETDLVASEQHCSHCDKKRGTSGDIWFMSEQPGSETVYCGVCVKRITIPELMASHESAMAFRDFLLLYFQTRKLPGLPGDPAPYMAEYKDRPSSALAELMRALCKHLDLEKGQTAVDKLVDNALILVGIQINRS